MDRPVRPTGDLDELRSIHRHLFQDIAGTTYTPSGPQRTAPTAARHAGTALQV